MITIPKQIILHPRTTQEINKLLRTQCSHNHKDHLGQEIPDELIILNLFRAEMVNLFLLVFELVLELKDLQLFPVDLL